jgi:hypothetical protein
MREATVSLLHAEFFKDSVPSVTCQTQFSVLRVAMADLAYSRSGKGNTPTCCNMNKNFDMGQVR